MGESAIVAAEFASTVTCIDPMETAERDLPGYRPHELGNEDIFWANIRRAGIEDRVELIVALSSPFPPELRARRWDTALVDGDHTTAGVLLDLIHLRFRIRDWMIIDDASLANLARSAFWEEAPEWAEEPCYNEDGEEIDAVLLRRKNA